MLIAPRTESCKAGCRNKNTCLARMRRRDKCHNSFLCCISGYKSQQKPHAAVRSQTYDAFKHTFCTKLTKECVIRIRQVCRLAYRTTVPPKMVFPMHSQSALLCKRHAPKFSLLHPTPLP